MRIAPGIGLLLVAIASLPPLDCLRAEQLPAAGLTVPDAADMTRDKLAEIATWLSDRYSLPRVSDMPAVELVPADRLVTLRYKGLLPDRRSLGASVEAKRRIIAVYDDARRTIYLPEGWSGKTLGERSILVHEMVHHLQNLSGQTFECAGAREKLAYQAHDDWLKANGSDLEKEFEIDLFTVLALALCM